MMASARSSTLASARASPPASAASSEPRIRSKASRPPDTGSERLFGPPPKYVRPTGSPLLTATRARAAETSAEKASLAPGAPVPR